MKKIGVFIVLFLLAFSITLATATRGDDCNATIDCSSGEICQNNVCSAGTSISSSTTSTQQDSAKIEDGFDCLEEKADDCSGLSTQEIAYTILATPDNIFDDCVSELLDRESSDNWGNVRDTALAILALRHAGKNTDDSEEWLLNHARTPTDLTWYLQQDSNAAAECHIGYQTNDYTINIGTNKKIDTNAGTCLTRAESNFWLKVDPNCYGEDFIIECNENFIATLLYKNQNSPIIYVLDGTESAPGLTGSITLSVNSKCFGTSSCEYEATLWATLALLKTGHNIEAFIPYVVAMADTNQRYLPEAFIYMITNYEDYANQLVVDQKLGGYWEASSSAYNRHYDTALALLSLGSSSSEQITKAKDWILFSQGANGCWQNNVRDTAIVLWALTGKSGRSSNGGGVTYCSQANYFCIPSGDCSSSQDVSDNYFCASLSESCCTSENLQSCSAYTGQVCAADKTCRGNTRKATDADSCCIGECVERDIITECEEEYYTCKDTCSIDQEATSLSCNGVQVCCKSKTTPTGGTPWWIWVLIILILVALIVIGWIKREQLKLYYFKLKTKFKKDKGSQGPSPGYRPGPGPRPGMPPRPGFPPIRRAPVQMQRRVYDQREPAMSDTFRKLREMSS